ncbi:ATP-binding protein [Dactylosporangium sp. CS-047395]|uniref:HAMP domain-containing sensor histidine kinase n=1 Tax=Dactylosporangium sp. CS-047395 TaxID=3239936 RepID=UPI003D8B2579
MLSRLGLRPRMAVSYVLVSAAAVLLVEAVLLAVLVPRVRAADRAAGVAQDRAVQAELQLQQVTVQRLAHDLAAAVGKRISVTGDALTAAVATDAFAVHARDASPGDDPVQVVADADGRVVAAAPADAFRPGGALPAAARAGGPTDGRIAQQRRTFAWAAEPIQAEQGVAGIAYVELDLTQRPSPAPAGSGPAIRSVVLPGAGALLLLVPVGALFGLLSTGRLIRRIRGLSDGTAAMAGGDLRVRLPVSGEDEVGRLERSFNTMAERLETAVAEQRAAAGAEARRAERGRIARELHDSISQDLFSVSLVAAGMRKALSPGSALQQQAEAMERSLARTMREMRALLLELRPIQLEDAGLAAALDELCRAYEVRLGIPVTADLAPVDLDASVEHAVLRVVQEAVGNAVRHGEPASIAVRLAADGDRVVVTVRDDGLGFDPREAGGRHGMGLDLMRERLREAGGTMEIASAPGQGTTVRVTLPAVPQWLG